MVRPVFASKLDNVGQVFTGLRLGLDSKLDLVRNEGQNVFEIYLSRLS